MSKIKPLPPTALCARCNPKQFRFKNTATVAELTFPIGQERAMAAIEFGLQIQQSGYNLYLLGPEGTGKHSAIWNLLTQLAKDQATPDDWCYVNNFNNSQKPSALNLPAGWGPILQNDMNDLINELSTSIPTIFESDEFRTRIQELEEEIKEKQEQWLSALQKDAIPDELTILSTPHGFAVAPLYKGEIITDQQLQNLPAQERRHKEININKMQTRVAELVEKISRWSKEKHDKQKIVQQEFTLMVVGGLIEELKKKYIKFEQVLAYLTAVQADLIENIQDFSSINEKSVKKTELLRYQINVFVTHEVEEGAPIVYEDYPTHANLIGRSEYQVDLGALTTNFTLIRPGALHRANGGYLILDIHKVLAQPYSWESLKRTLYSKKVTLETIGHSLGLPSTITLEPESIPLSIKVILLGERQLYYFLSEHDINFPDLFKVAADFSNHIPRNRQNCILYSRLITTIIRREKLLDLDRTAVARVIEHSSRLAHDTKRLSTHMRCLVDLLRESHYWARQAKRRIITAKDVQKAIDQQIYRANRVQQRIYEDVMRNILLINTDGSKIGQVNALSVMQLGNYAFSVPSRITATARLGKGEVIDIEREVALGGAIHSKGILILVGYLSGRYISDHHLSISASLVFEQNYGEIEGDSASAAELSALLSAIGKLPIKQSLAVTGSVNQHGQIQAIGNVNEKIEGFFNICQERGLNGEQGVLIPIANIQHLMLKEEVVSAAENKLFHIYSVDTIDEVMELLTGLKAGKRNKAGKYPFNSVNYAIEKNLLHYVERIEEEHREHKEQTDGGESSNGH